MPSSPVLSRPRRDSWPPTQVRLDPVLPAMDSSDDMDEDPLTYFLTPAPDIEEDIDDDLMDFDAGIEDASHPRDTVRSVSPSSLDGLDKTKNSRRLSPEPPELSDSGASPYDDDSDEDYIRFQAPASHRLGLPFSLRDFAIDGVKVPPRRSRTAPAATGDALLSPPPPTARRPRPTAASRGRSPAQAHIRGRTGPAPPRLRPQHVWREPSPDVWSIEEETTEDLGGGDADAEVRMGDAGSATDGSNTTKIVEIPAAKPKKKVRFVLPVKE